MQFSSELKPSLTINLAPAEQFIYRKSSQGTPSTVTRIVVFYDHFELYGIPRIWISGNLHKLGWDGWPSRIVMPSAVRVVIAHALDAVNTAYWPALKTLDDAVAHDLPAKLATHIAEQEKLERNS